ncbi:RQC-minor-1 family DNA-binding protein [Gracilibacillus massiliensis]|uniref:RQC-minor-1 family DNA-binding protein n=1 Tax=Gracilibacillus massiliensis TaxID=1564956 RepID=UPI000B0882A0|nr:RQC-minor-1 family DNA-binding protein [Gracilibacillus massiliensis]
MKKLTEPEIMAILRAADELIGEGGRNLLAKILKGSKEKKLLALHLDKCPVYGYFHKLSLAEVIEKIDWMIKHDFLEIQYSGRLPMIVFTDRGWELERDQRADEILAEWYQWIEQDDFSHDMTYLKDRNRGMILILLDKIKETGERRFIPLLEKWGEIDYKKVRKEIRATISHIVKNKATESDENWQIIRAELLKGRNPRDVDLKCMKCGNIFPFRTFERYMYFTNQWRYPRLCPECDQENR